MNVFAPIIVAQSQEQQTAVFTWQPFELFEKGGVLMWPLLVLSILSFMLIFSSIWTTRRRAIIPDEMVDSLGGLLNRKNYVEILNACNSDRSCFAKTVYAMINFHKSNPHANIDELREVTEAEGSRQSNRLSRQITWLSDIASITPMIGLLGTVVGMMTTFTEMATGNFEGVKQMQMASGIAVALITTASGLVPAILSMAAYYFFRTRIQKSVTDMEVATTHVLSIISVQMERGERMVRQEHIDTPQASSQRRMQPRF